MTLTARLTVFFLGTLGAVLAAFSGALYLLARSHLHGQLHDRAAGALATLTATGEVEPNGVEWEPRERKSPPRDRDSPLWAVFLPGGERLEGDPELSAWRDAPVPERRGTRVDFDGRRWLVVRRRITHPQAETLPATLEPHRYRALVFVVAWSVAPVDETLRTLAWSLAGISLLVWTTSAAAARRVCRRALRPVASMAVASQAITLEKPGDRLPVPAPQDELRDLALAFNDLLARFQDSFERQRRFAGEASHQLRTPLTAMLGQIEVALRRDRDPEDYRSALTAAHAQALRLRGIIESLLFLTRADADALRPALRRTDIGAWLAEYALETWAAHPRWSDFRLHLLPADGGGSPSADVHPVLLGQALGNLLENAWKFSPAGSEVDVRVGSQDGAISIDVLDRGCGIEEADRGRLFQPFFRAASARTAGVPGTGLGLAIAARIVAAMGGVLEWHGPSEGGSRFRIMFPVSSPAHPHETSTPD